MPQWTPVKLLQQPGFWFSGQQFGQDGNADHARRMYHALCDDDMATKGKALLKKRGRIKATELFTTCIGYEGMFLLWRYDFERVFKLVNESWHAYSDLEPSDTRQIVDNYVIARRSYVGQVQATELTKLVDRFISIWDRVLEKLHEEFVAGVEPIMPQEHNFVNSALSVSSYPTWPPEEFSNEEHYFLADTRLRDELYNVTCKNTKMAEMPSADTHPLEIKKFLCLAALSHFPERRNFPLYMRPIGYLTNGERRKAFMETSGMSKMYGTLQEFMEFYQTMHRKYFRKTVIGLIIDKNHEACLVLVLRKFWLEHASLIQLTVFGPSGDPALGLGFDSYREKIMDMIRRHSLNIFEAWWGGYNPGTTDEPEDIVRVACQFVVEVVKDQEFFPLHDRYDTMVSRGFERLEDPSWTED